MKKIIRIAAGIVAVAAMTCILFACGDGAKTDNGTNSDLEKLKEQIESLDAELKRVDDLENQVADLEEELASKNVFWTEKAEYAEDETMTVYYGKNAVFSITIADSGAHKDADTVGMYTYITSFMTDLYASAILKTAYIEFDGQVCMNNGSYSDTMICKRNVLETMGCGFRKNGMFANVTNIDLVLCVPGTPFPLAKFTNITLLDYQTQESEGAEK